MDPQSCVTCAPFRKRQPRLATRAFLALPSFNVTSSPLKTWDRSFSAYRQLLSSKMDRINETNFWYARFDRAYEAWKDGRHAEADNICNVGCKVVKICPLLTVWQLVVNLSNPDLNPDGLPVRTKRLGGRPPPMASVRSSTTR